MFYFYCKAEAQQNQACPAAAQVDTRLSVMTRVQGHAQRSCAEVMRRGHAQGSCAGVMRGPANRAAHTHDDAGQSSSMGVRTSRPWRPRSTVEVVCLGVADAALAALLGALEGSRTGSKKPLDREGAGRHETRDSGAQGHVAAIARRRVMHEELTDTLRHHLGVM